MEESSLFYIFLFREISFLHFKCSSSIIDIFHGVVMYQITSAARVCCAQYHKSLKIEYLITKNYNPLVESKSIIYSCILLSTKNENIPGETINDK